MKKPYKIDIIQAVRNRRLIRGHVFGKDRKQLEIISLDELVTQQSAARQIDKLIDVSDTSYFVKIGNKGNGSPAIQSQRYA